MHRFQRKMVIGPLAHAPQVPREWNGFAYVCDGAGEVSGTRAAAEQALVLGPGDRIIAHTDNAAGMRFLLAAGRPIGEPVVQHGPFVMNTQVRRGLCASMNMFLMCRCSVLLVMHSMQKQPQGRRLPTIVVVLAASLALSLL